MNDGPRTITEARELLVSGALTPSTLLEICLARIDKYEPSVQAWAYLDRARARHEAAKLDRAEYREPLWGIPVGIKDIIDVADMPTGCGSRLWANSIARDDATCVRRLRDAGALILGKTVTTPYAFTDPAKTRNPWNTTRTPGGSSSGSAAAVACGMCLAALGTQTGGSTTRPASYCGVASLKASYGRVSAKGSLALAAELDHVGIMANDVRGLAVVFECIAGPDGWLEANREPVPDCSATVEANGTAPPGEYLTAGGLFDAHCTPAMRLVFAATLAKIAAFHAPVSKVVMPACFAEVPTAHRLIMAVGAADVHAERLARHPDDYPSAIRKLVEEGIAANGLTFARARKLQDGLREQFDAILGEKRFLLVPAATDFAPTLETTGNPVFNVPWSFLGAPTVSVPVGWNDDGMPFAVQLVGATNNEAKLLCAARYLEWEFALPPRPLPEPT